MGGFRAPLPPVSLALPLTFPLCHVTATASHLSSGRCSADVDILGFLHPALPLKKLEGPQALFSHPLQVTAG